MHGVKIWKEGAKSEVKLKSLRQLEDLVLNIVLAVIERCKKECADE